MMDRIRSETCRSDL